MSVLAQRVMSRASEFWKHLPSPEYNVTRTLVKLFQNHDPAGQDDPQTLLKAVSCRNNFLLPNASPHSRNVHQLMADLQTRLTTTAQLRRTPFMFTLHCEASRLLEDAHFLLYHDTDCSLVQFNTMKTVPT